MSACIIFILVSAQIEPYELANAPGSCRPRQAGCHENERFRRGNKWVQVRFQGGHSPFFADDENVVPVIVPVTFDDLRNPSRVDIARQLLASLPNIVGVRKGAER